MGVVASALATVITYPIQVVQMNARVIKSRFFSYIFLKSGRQYRDFYLQHGHGLGDLKKNASMIEVYIYILR